ncbi:carbohydrate ABC transporter permease [Denitrobaculum tricleocarpae]|uniref:Carbohydrate ABC transporter permease n=1 Tax=Denitrobaculum tricleocarpae TaxID=2591009 RepID=A0A545TUP6_9PROT|nr:carbohydrate ABC transporter permease [Denitrobaculum tricleocarpae]TQV80881.1 carbohydrate ABC transporter permease [Denitrobaculum tricleocarpae]
MFPRPIEKASTAHQVAYKAALPVALIAWLLPLIAVMLTSARSIEDLNKGNYWGLPEKWMLIENYSEIFRVTPMATYMLNSIIITLPTVVVSVAFATMAGFALAKYNIRFRILLFAIFVGGNFIPFQILMIPVRTLTIDLGFYDTPWALIVFHTAFQTGFCTLFMRNFIAALPNELIEAARVEGVSEWKIFRHIIVPLVRPALAALSVLIFTFVWNDYFWSLVLVQSDEVRPITAGLNALKGQWLASWQLISAGSIIAALPPVALFFLMQRHFIAGLTLGATKG